MKFQPRSEEEVKKPFTPIAKGIYDFEVLEATDEVSSAGNDMIKIKIGIWIGDKIVCNVFDYLLPKLEAKLRHACDSCGLLDKYQSGTLSSWDFVGRTGKVKIKIDKETNEYPAKNSVEDYVCRPAKDLNAQHVAPPQQDDNLPF
jgi:hypothetical protein